MSGASKISTFWTFFMSSFLLSPLYESVTGVWLMRESFHKMEFHHFIRFCGETTPDSRQSRKMKKKERIFIKLHFQRLSANARHRIARVGAKVRNLFVTVVVGWRAWWLVFFCSRFYGLRNEKEIGEDDEVKPNLHQYKRFRSPRIASSRIADQ